MIPSVIASQVERGIQDYLRTTFPLSNPFFRDILERLFEERDRLFKGPYISVNLPFHTGSFPLDYFESFTMKFPPYVHQEKAFLRLGGEEGRSTLIATGTGSGKTECFLYPLLDYCYRHRGEPGIKAILIYPMNALAVNQATRIAQTIYNNPGLRGNVTAGLFVGMGPGAKTTPLMAQDMVVTHQEVMRNSPGYPPDKLQDVGLPSDSSQGLRAMEKE